MFNEQRILVTGIGGPAAQAFVKALNGTGARIIVADADPLAPGLNVFPSTNRLVVPAGDEPSFAKHLLDECLAHGVTVVVPTVDAELLPLARERRRFERYGIRLLLSSTACLQTCVDKWSLYRACRGTLPLPKTELLTSQWQPDGLQFPVIVKPRRASGGRGFRIVESPSEIAPMAKDGTLIVQEFLPGAEYSVDTLSNELGDVLATVPRERLRTDSGIAVTARTVHDAELERLARQTAAHIGLTYTGNIQFKRNRDDEPRLLEVNPRFPGTMSLTVASGINMPLQSLGILLGEYVEVCTDFRETAMVRTWKDHVVDVDDLGTTMETAPISSDALCPA